jgi:hypothetical protein
MIKLRKIIIILNKDNKIIKLILKILIIIILMNNQAMILMGIKAAFLSCLIVFPIKFFHN